MTKEYGFPLCKNGKPIGVHHSHPGGSLKLSPQDIRTGIEKKLDFICVAITNRRRRQIKCYRFKKT